jgi:hypothetical protein
MLKTIKLQIYYFWRGQVRTISDRVLLIIILSICFAFYANQVRAQVTINISRVDSTKVKLQNAVITILKTNCSVAGCHRGAYPKKKLNLEPDKFLESVLNVPSQEINSLKRVNTKNPEKSYLLMKIRGDKGIKGSRMPDDAPPLKKEEIKAIEDWIFSLKEPGAEKEKAPPSEGVKTKSKK